MRNTHNPIVHRLNNWGVDFYESYWINKFYLDRILNEDIHFSWHLQVFVSERKGDAHAFS